MKYQVGDLFVGEKGPWFYIKESMTDFIGTQLIYEVHYFHTDSIEYISKYHVSSIDCMVQPSGGWKHYPVGNQT